MQHREAEIQAIQVWIKEVDKLIDAASKMPPSFCRELMLNSFQNLKSNFEKEILVLEEKLVPSDGL